VLLQGGLDRLGIDVAGADAARLERAPAIGPLLFVLLQNHVAPLAAIEIPHGGVGLLQALEEVENSLSVGGQLHFRAQVHVDEEIVA